MKRDLNLIRELLLWAETHCVGRTIASTQIKLENYSNQQIIYHILLLQDAGFIDYGISRSVNNNKNPHFSRLTNSGHDFLDSIRQDTIFDQVKQKLAEGANSVALEVVKSLAIKLCYTALGI